MGPIYPVSEDFRLSSPQWCRRMPPSILAPRRWDSGCSSGAEGTADNYKIIKKISGPIRITRRKKYGFKEILRIKEYWGYKYPSDWCKECRCKPCKCTNVIFVKELNDGN